MGRNLESKFSSHIINISYENDIGGIVMTTTDYDHNIVLANGKYQVIGTRPMRHDGADKVTGKAQYGADFTTSGILYCKVLRSPHAHARIKSIDTSKAEAHPGVRAVVTGRDFPPTSPGETCTCSLGTFKVKDMREANMATEKVLYKGHPVAGVAAASSHEAEEVMNLIDVEYEILPPVLTAPDAMNTDAPMLHDNLKTTEAGEETDKVSNVAEHIQHLKGDVDKGFALADVVIEKEFNTSTVHQGYIEPHNCTVDWNKDGRVHIWISTQAPFDVRDQTAGILGLPISQLKVTPMEIGGGFGGKWEPYVEPVAALLSKKTGHPVKNVMTRAEELECTGPTPGSYIKVKMGATKDGKIVAAQAHLAYEAGAYPGSPVGAGCQCVFSAYDIPNVLIDGYDVVVNKPKSAAYRAPGASNAAFASETIVDEIADNLKMDPIDFRLLNAAKEGTRRADGTTFSRVGCVEVLEAMKNHPHYSTPLKGPNHGRGVAVAFWINGGGQSTATISVNKDGTVSLIEGSPDIGGTRTSISMQAAEVLGIPVEKVQPSVVDTDSVAFTPGTGGSRVTFSTGFAAYEAAQDVKRQMIERAALIWGIDKDSITMDKGILQSKTDSTLRMTFAELAAQLNDSGGVIVGRATVDPAGVGNAFAGCITDVEVDPETGKVNILRFTAVQDAGKAIHPSYVEGQMQGGCVQGIGWALNEEYYMNESGHMLNSSLLDYRMPISLDIPMIDTVIVEVPNPGHPFGARGVGEASIVPPPATLANAIYNAIGVRMNKLPMNPEAIVSNNWSRNKS